MLTHRGRDYFEVSSAFQKSIRRGLLYESIYFGLELYRTNNVKVSQYFVFKNVWNRLMIISVEDIGPANPMAIYRVVYAYSEAKKTFSMHRPMNEEPLIKAICYLTRCAKSRVNDWASLIDYEASLDTDLYKALLEKDTRKALVILHGLVKAKAKAKNFVKHASDKHKIIWDCFDKIFSDKLWYLDALKTAEKECEPYRIDKCYLIYIHLVHMSINKDIVYNVVEELPIVFDRNDDLSIPDYAYDKHNEKGRLMGRGFLHFIEVGSVLANESLEWSELSKEYLSIVKRQKLIE